ncbi:unnamed protein product, partial [marine sediment metagenome]
SGDAPIINGSDLVTTWSDEGSNVWSATFTRASAPQAVWFDGTAGNKQTALEDVDSDKDWYWDSNVLYIYSTSDPDTAYS